MCVRSYHQFYFGYLNWHSLQQCEIYAVGWIPTYNSMNKGFCIVLPYSITLCYSPSPTVGITALTTSNHSGHRYLQSGVIRTCGSMSRPLLQLGYGLGRRGRSDRSTRSRSPHAAVLRPQNLAFALAFALCSSIPGRALPTQAASARNVRAVSRRSLPFERWQSWWGRWCHAEDAVCVGLGSRYGQV